MITSTVTLSYSGDTYVLDVVLNTTNVVVEITQARDPYQLWLAEGNVGTRQEWLASLEGEPGASIESVILTLPEYMALTVEEQLDPLKIYVVPKSL